MADNLQRIEQLIATYAQNQGTTDFMVDAKGNYWTNYGFPPIIANELNVFVNDILVFRRYEEMTPDYIPELFKAKVIVERNEFLGRMYNELVNEGF